MKISIQSLSHFLRKCQLPLHKGAFFVAISTNYPEIAGKPPDSPPLPKGALIASGNRPALPEARAEIGLAPPVVVVRYFAGEGGTPPLQLKRYIILQSS